MVLISYAISLSLKIIDSTLKRKTVDFKVVMNKYLYVLIVSFVLIIITSLLEVFMVPAIMKIVISMIK